MNMAAIMTAMERVFDFIFRWCGIWLVMNSITALLLRTCPILRVQEAVTAKKVPAEEDEDTVDQTEEKGIGVLATAAVVFRELAEAADRKAAKDTAESAKDVESTPEDEAEPGGADELSDQQEGEDGHAD